MVNRFWACALLVFATHNAEEVLAFANGWSIEHLPRLTWTPQWPMLAVAATTLTLLVGLGAWSLRASPERSAWWLRLFLRVMLLNAIWHAGVSAYTRSLAPGVVTAVLLITPVFTIFLRQLSLRRPAAGPLHP